MLDKSLPYHSIIMAADAAALERTTAAPLPEGFSYRFFADGDERSWARLETSVLEFENEQKALAYFNANFPPYGDALTKRCVFVAAPDGTPVATTMAWCENPKEPAAGRPFLHWVSTAPEHQGLGLGRAVVTRAMTLFPVLHPGQEAFLHTQTWSHRAVRLYHKLGFRICRTRVFQNIDVPAPKLHVNEYAAAMEVLRQAMKKEEVDELAATSIE